MQVSEKVDQTKVYTRSRKVLVLSPFASHPPDAGHRRRVLQTTRMLRDAGFEVTFLLYAFELPWYWRFDKAAFQQMQAEWGDVQVYPASRKVGQPPEDGRTHSLDEWWDVAFEEYLRRLFNICAFDAMVIHNVWMSNAFDLAPPSTVKILETHDIFWKRGELYQRLNQPIDFFTPSQDDEVFGLNRADVILTVTDEELELIKPLVAKPAFTIPTYEPQNRVGSAAVGKYLHPKKVTFGMLGSAHMFNILGLQRLLNALERKVGKTYAPVDIVIGGDVGDAVTSSLPIKRLGYVPVEADFFDQVDFVIAPLFEGTGFKVKVADAVIFEKPLLAATHAAEGTYLSPFCCSDTPEEMADHLVRIALERPALTQYVQMSKESSLRMSQKTDQGHALMRRAIEVGQPLVMLDLSNLRLAADLPVIVSYLSYLRPFSHMARVYIAPPADIMAALAKSLVAGAAIVSRQQLADLNSANPRALRICPKPDPHWGPEWISDDRWFPSHARSSADSAMSLHELMPTPMAHPEVKWMPVMQTLRRRLSKELSSQTAPREIVFMDGYGQSKSNDNLSGTLIVDTSDDEVFSRAAAWMLTLADGAVEVVWAAQWHDPRRQFVFEISLLKKFRYWGGAQGTNSEIPGHMYAIEDSLIYTFDLTMKPLLRNLL